MKTFFAIYVDTGGTYPGQDAQCDLTVGEVTRKDDPAGSGTGGTIEPEAFHSSCTMPGDDKYCKLR